MRRHRAEAARYCCGPRNGIGCCDFVADFFDLADRAGLGGGGTSMRSIETSRPPRKR
jgi:hypothetical protein